MQPRIEFLSRDLVGRVLDEAFQLIAAHGVKVQHEEARALLSDAGVRVDCEDEIAYIPQAVAQQALHTVPHEFWLHNRAGEPVIRYGGDAVHFDPGSSGVHMFNAVALAHPPSTTRDLARVVRLVEMLPQYDAQSTAILCNDVPKEIGDLFRLYVVLRLSQKPIVTGAFASQTTQSMIDMLTIFAGGREALQAKPQAVFDVCPSPPLIWSQFGAQNLIDLARAGVPAEIVSMPLSGAAGPVTLIGSVVQHAAECISGIVIHQLARPGAPVIWGGAPAIMDMRTGTTPMGAIETAILDAAYTQVGKSLNFPTHTYLGASDAKLIDAQAGFESGMTALVGALAGTNMVSGAGMLDFLQSQSLEKLVIDAEIIGMAKRLLQGVMIHTGTLGLEFFEGIAFKGEFLKQKATGQLFAREQYIPSAVVDRGSVRAWEQNGKLDAVARARQRVDDLLGEYAPPLLPEGQIAALDELVGSLAKQVGMDALPDVLTI
jgi:trimethylamine--corrinoid protein Co-methyltransferase